MERRFVLFLVLSFAVLIGHAMVMRQLNPPKPREGANARQGVPPEADRPPGEPQPGKEPGDRQEQPPPQPPKQEPEEPEKPPEPPEAIEQKGPPTAPRRFGTLGSADPGDPWRMLATWDNKGGAVARVEPNSPGYRDLDNRSGYLGHLVIDEAAALKAAKGRGCTVQVVGPGTPAAKARVGQAPDAPPEALPAGAPRGLRPGDLIQALGEEKITAPADLRRALKATEPGQNVTLTVERDGRQLTLEVTLGRRPLEVIRPEANGPLSFLLTLHQLDGQKIPEGNKQEQDKGRPAYLDKELPGLELRSANWEVVDAATNRSQVTFRRRLPKGNLVITKTFRLQKVPREEQANPDFRAYHLALDLRIVNHGDQPREIAYQLDGPTGLPTEGWWYTRKYRDVAISKEPGGYDLIGSGAVAEDDFGRPAYDDPPQVRFIGVDAQYFSAVLIPREKGRRFAWQPLRVGRVDERLKELTNSSCRLISPVHAVKPGERSALTRRFEIFVGPKRPALLAEYGLEELVAYGWFGGLARPMSWVLHFFYAIVGNYGLAIILLTVVVRGCMFPLSRKQALGARKMQELQPEIKRIQEKYKKDIEARTKAQQELFRKHKYNPLSGCLVLLVQFPIFIALYRALMVDIELRQAPLLWQGFPWCSNLAAPDMLFEWSGFMPRFLTDGVGFVELGPYFNLLPVITIALIIVQQKMFMPPPTDEQAALQQKIMSFMWVFFGVIFFRVASGLCVYFIASSLWGLAERKFLPKAAPAAPAAAPRSRAEAKAQPKPRPKPTSQAAPPSGDGAAARRKRKKSKRGKR